MFLLYIISYSGEVKEKFLYNMRRGRREKSTCEDIQEYYYIPNGIYNAFYGHCHTCMHVML